MGDSVCVPRGAPHAYRNVGDRAGRLLVFFPQSERMLGFFEELAEPVSDPSTWTSSGPPPLERGTRGGKALGHHARGPAARGVVREYGNACERRRESRGAARHERDGQRSIVRAG